LLACASRTISTLSVICRRYSEVRISIADIAAESYETIRIIIDLVRPRTPLHIYSGYPTQVKDRHQILGTKPYAAFDMRFSTLPNNHRPCSGGSRSRNETTENAGGGGWGPARSLASERSATGKRGSSIPLFAVVSTYIHVSRSSAGAVFVCSAWRPGIEAGHIHPRSHSPCLSYVVNERFVIRSVRSTVSIRIAFVVVVSGVILSLPAPVQLARSIETVPRRKQGATTEPFTPAI
jgi:hypothetical protein